MDKEIEKFIKLLQEKSELTLKRKQLDIRLEGIEREVEIKLKTLQGRKAT